MSWQTYIDNLMSSGHMTSTGIFGHDGVTWASSQDFPVATNEVKQLIAGIADSSKVSSGITVNNERFILIRSDPGTYVILKKGTSGLVAYKTNKTVLIGLHDGSVKAEQVCTDIGKMADYLNKSGY